jgi:serine/threonine protein kinase
MEQFGRYQLMHQLATGGMGEIFLARSASISGFAKDLVIKRIRPELTSNVRLVSMFLNEAQISMSLSHQNVVQVFDFGQVEEAYFLAMEHVHGCDLIQVLNLESVLGTGLPPGLALYVMSEVCRGLDYAHTSIGTDGQVLNLIHRDMSPDNIMLSKDGGVKIADFGISNFADEISERKNQRLEGKVPYMSPEQAQSLSTDARSDVYSCGIVLWELLTGEPAFPGDIDKAMLRRVQTGEIERPIRRNRKLTRKLDKLVMTALNPDPNKRFQSAREFGEAMRLLLSKKYDGFDSHDLRLFMSHNKEELGVVDLARVCPPLTAKAFTGQSAETVHWSNEFDYPPDVISRVRSFCESPNLLELGNLAELMADLQDSESAIIAYRIAMIKFAQQGLLAQALKCAIQIRALAPQDQDLSESMSRVPSLVGYTNEKLLPYLFNSTSAFAELMSYIVVATLNTNITPVPACPWLSKLSQESFAELIRVATVQKYSPTSLIVTEGLAGDSMFLLVSGRTLVYSVSAEGQKVYLASLTAGEFFGEQSFFGTPIRNATVEAMEHVEVIEFNRALVDQVMLDNPDAESILLELYKSRVVDGIMARSEIFGVLSVEGRKNILAHLVPKSIPPGEFLVREGESSREAYIVKTGKGEAITLRDGEELSLGILEAGTIIGEVAALKNVPRTASVRALERMEVLEMPEELLGRLEETAPQLIRRIDTVAGRRQKSRDSLVEFKIDPLPSNE